MSGVLVVPPIAHGLVGRTDLPIPAWLFGWGAAVVLVLSFVALAVLWPKPRLEGARERRVLHVPRVAGDPVRAHRHRAVRARRLRGPRGRAGRHREPRADLRLRAVLGRAAAAAGAARRRVRALQPVARGRARGRLGVRPPRRRLPAGADGVPGEAGSLARGDRDPLLRLARARLHEPLGPVDALRPDPGLRRHPARRDEPLRGRRSGSATATRSPSTSTSSRVCRRCAGSAGRSTCARCCRA